jgi:pantoate--beta-alanine ligase
MSSRNTYLDAEQRAQAPVLRRGLLAAQKAFRAGETSAAKLTAIVARQIATAPIARIDYVAAVDGESLEPVTKLKRGDTIALAVFFGKTRLIDNIQT